jgi:endonuclease/exonuclease/phosphatase family metal-dependent hydrolase
MSITRRLALALTLLSHLPSLAGAADEQPLDVRVMTFNIRYGTANDGENRWDNRRQWLVETVKAFNPDLLGTQETLGFQRDYLAEQLPGYGVLGVGRDDGKEQGEMMALYYKRDRFKQLDAGHFWLSETPERAGSKSWDSSLPRMVTWIKLQDLKRADAPPIAFFNTHFDHRGPQARLQSARLIREQVGALGRGCSLIVTGDFNAGEGSEPYKSLFAEQGGQPSPLVDCFRAVHAQRGTEEGTASGFRANNTRGQRIDWIACSRDWTVVSAAIDRTAKDGRTPSDHFPVTVILRPSAQQPARSEKRVPPKSQR